MKTKLSTRYCSNYQNVMAQLYSGTMKKFHQIQTIVISYSVSNNGNDINMRVTTDDVSDITIIDYPHEDEYEYSPYEYFRVDEKFPSRSSF